MLEVSQPPAGGKDEIRARARVLLCATLASVGVVVDGRGPYGGARLEPTERGYELLYWSDTLSASAEAAVLCDAKEMLRRAGLVVAQLTSSSLHVEAAR